MVPGETATVVADDGFYKEHIMGNENLLSIIDLQLEFPQDDGVITVLDKVCLEVGHNEIFALVGESGSGKSLTAKSVMRLIDSPPARYSGAIEFDGGDMLALSMPEIRKKRGKDVSMIFQEPMTSLNPVLTVERQVSEAILLHQAVPKREARRKTVEILEKVGIPSPETHLKSYPGELSGGMRQRVMIAMAISCQPKLLIADEPTTALDVTIQAQILELMLGIKRESGMSIVLITHDLGVVAEFSERVAVMYLGQVLESAPTGELFANPLHPYTRGLLESLPRMDVIKERFVTIPGAIPDPANSPAGCKFNNRCRYATEQCMTDCPPMRQVAGNHRVRCWREA